MVSKRTQCAFLAQISIALLSAVLNASMQARGEEFRQAGGDAAAYAPVSDFDAGQLEQDWRRQKTLLSWNGVPASNDEPEEDTIHTDRPHISEASSLVGLGTLQIETGYSYFRDLEDGVLVETHSFPEPLLRAGVFAEWFEFRLGYNYFDERIKDPFGNVDEGSGSDDLYIGAKLALTTQVGALPEVAIFPQARLPTGANRFTSHEVLPGFNLAYSWKINDFLELECNTQVNRRFDFGDHYYTELIQTCNFEFALTERLGAFTEWFVIAPNGAIEAHNQWYFHSGFVYLLTSDVQLDLHAATGLTRASNDLAFSGIGLSWRR